MLEALEILKWPLIASLLLPGILVYLGLHIVAREIIFVDLALAQVAALGHCVAILFQYDAHAWQTYALSVSFTLVGAAAFSLTRIQHHRVSQEALIGIVYVVTAAASLLVLSRTAEGKEELQRTLVGEVLVVKPVEIWQTLALFTAVAVVHFIFRKQFLMISFEPERAAESGLRIRAWDFLFYALFGIVVTSFVHLGGILLVFSYLIIPAVCANYVAESLRTRIALGWAVSMLASVAGIYVSYRFDFPMGAAIVCMLGAALAVTGVGVAIRRASRTG